MSNRRRPKTPQAAETRTYWNGLPTRAVRGTAVVADSPEFPQYWARDLIGQRINVVVVDLNGVNHGGGFAVLDDRDDSGWLKVTEGRGSPHYGHADLSIVEGSFRPHSRLGRINSEVRA